MRPSSAEPIGKAEFEQAWAEHPGRRYDYGMNRALFALYFLLVAGFWSFWGVRVDGDGLDSDLVFLGVLFSLVSLFVLATGLYWAKVRGSSGVVCAPDRLLWRYSGRAFAARWGTLDVERLGLLDRTNGEDRWALRVLGQPLPLLGPHLRLRNIELFLTMVLMALKEHGRIAAGEERTK